MEWEQVYSWVAGSMPCSAMRAQSEPCQCPGNFFLYGRFWCIKHLPKFPCDGCGELTNSGNCETGFYCDRCTVAQQIKGTECGGDETHFTDLQSGLDGYCDYCGSPVRSVIAWKAKPNWIEEGEPQRNFHVAITGKPVCSGCAQQGIRWCPVSRKYWFEGPEFDFDYIASTFHEYAYPKEPWALFCGWRQNINPNSALGFDALRVFKGESTFKNKRAKVDQIEKLMLSGDWQEAMTLLMAMILEMRCKDERRRYRLQRGSNSKDRRAAN